MLTQTEKQDKVEDCHTQKELDGSRRELDRLMRYKAARFQKLQHVDALRRQGGLIDPHDHDARDAHKLARPGASGTAATRVATGRPRRASPRPAEGTLTYRLPQNAMTGT